jgi:hypothetical protein
VKPNNLIVDGKTPGRALITSRAELADAVLIALAAAQRLVRALHRDLSLFDLASVACVERIETFLLAHRNARVRLLVDDAHWLDLQAPRLRLLHRRFPHALEMRVASTDDPVGDDAYLLADHHGALNLRPSAQSRGDVWLHNEPQVQPLSSAFDRRWDAAAHNIAVVPLGLG